MEQLSRPRQARGDSPLPAVRNRARCVYRHGRRGPLVASILSFWVRMKEFPVDHWVSGTAHA